MAWIREGRKVPAFYRLHFFFLIPNFYHPNISNDILHSFPVFLYSIALFRNRLPLYIF